MPALVASPILLTATHWMPAGVWQHAAYGLGALGATGLVATAMVPGPFAAWLQTRPMQFVGRRSFSLYLVHEPIVVATAFALGGRPSTLVLLACVALPIAAATMAFYRCVERPTQTLARTLGQRSSELVHGAPPPGGPRIEGRDVITAPTGPPGPLYRGAECTRGV